MNGGGGLSAQLMADAQSSPRPHPSTSGEGSSVKATAKLVITVMVKHTILCFVFFPEDCDERTTVTKNFLYLFQRPLFILLFSNVTISWLSLVLLRAHFSRPHSDGFARELNVLPRHSH